MAFKQRQLIELLWEKPGTVVEGRLLRAQTVKYSDGIGMKYLVRDGNGKLVSFKGSARLDTLLQTSDVGKLIRVKFVGLDSTREPKPGYSAPKVFDVEVDDESQEALPLADGSPAITDDDIPF